MTGARFDLDALVSVQAICTTCRGDVAVPSRDAVTRTLDSGARGVVYLEVAHAARCTRCGATRLRVELGADT